jgi:hypothetical protein
MFNFQDLTAYEKFNIGTSCQIKLEVPYGIKIVLTPQGIADAHLVSFLAKIISKTYSIWASTAKGRQTLR